MILLTSTVNMDWTSWPGSPSYGAMMHELTRLAVSGRLREQAQTVGVALEEYLPGPPRSTSPSISRPACTGREAGRASTRR